MSHRIKSQYYGIVVGVMLCLFYFPASGQEASLLTKNKGVVRAYIDVVINGHNLSRKSDFFHVDYVWHKMDGESVRSSKDTGHTAILRWLFSAVPDIHYQIVNIEAGGDMVGITTTASGTAQSEFFGLPAARKKVSFTQMFFYLIRDGKIA